MGHQHASRRSELDGSNALLPDLRRDKHIVRDVPYPERLRWWRSDLSAPEAVREAVRDPEVRPLGEDLA